MASRFPETPPDRENIPLLDKISCENELVQRIPAGRIAVTLLLVTMSNRIGEYATLYHCEVDNQRRTFIKGHWPALGLNEPDEEKEFMELRGIRLVQSLISIGASVYVLADTGVMYTMGIASTGQLGRRTDDVAALSFGAVSLDRPILSVACGLTHCLAMSQREVFAFGENGFGEVGVSSFQMVQKPTEIYAATGDRAPCQVAAADRHSAILNKRGEVFTFGNGSYGQTGHGGTDSTRRPTLVKAITAKVQQIGCAGSSTFFLANGQMFGCGYNMRLATGKRVKKPTLIDTGGHQITDFRCSYSAFVAYTESRDTLIFRGKYVSDGIIHVPRVEQLEYPRDFLSLVLSKDTGGSVCPVPKKQVTAPQWGTTTKAPVKQESERSVVTHAPSQQLIDELLSKQAVMQLRIDALQESHDQLLKRNEELEESMNCHICMTNRRAVVFSCGHSACQSCSSQINICHICREQITSRLSFFL